MRSIIKKHINRGIVSGYSNFEQFRMFMGAVEVIYTNPSNKRLREIESYSEHLVTSPKTNFKTKKKANVLAGECRDQIYLKDALARFSRLKREGVL